MSSLSVSALYPSVITPRLSGSHERKEAALMRPGTYRDRDGNLVTVRYTPTGYEVRHADGTTTLIGGRA